MKTFNVHEAKTNFSAILAMVAAGEDFVVAKAGTPVAIISAFRKPTSSRQPGLFRCQVKISEAFFEPMEPEFLEHFE